MQRDVQIPNYVHLALQEDLQRLIKEGHRCLIYSAGALTQTLFKKGYFSNLNIVGIIDRNLNAYPRELFNIEVIHPKDIEKKSPDAILICSTRFHLEIITSLLSTNLSNKIEIIDLCKDELKTSYFENRINFISQRLNRLEKIHTLECISEIRSLHSMQIKNNPLRLEQFGFKCYSQHEEDGIISEILKRLGNDVRKTFIEFGVGNGLENNSLLLLKQGWSGLWMDGERENSEFIKANFNSYLQSNQLYFTEAFVNTDNINDLILSSSIGDVGLLSIDIDGNDYHVWKAIEAIHPSIVIIEYNGKFPPPIRWTITYDPNHTWDLSDYQGASLAALYELGKIKGYQLIGCNITGVNAFFVRQDLLNESFLVSDDLMDYYHPARYYLTEGYQLLGGHRPDPRQGLFW